MVTFLDNHDLPRIASTCESERVNLALSFQFLMRGTPAMTYGTETGLEGALEPDNRTDMDHDPEHPRRVLVTQLLKLRRSHPALQRGLVRIHDVDEDHLVLTRRTETEVALVAVNLSETVSTLTPAADWPSPLHPVWPPSSRDEAGGEFTEELLMGPNELRVWVGSSAKPPPPEHPESNVSQVRFRSPRESSEEAAPRLVGAGVWLGSWTPDHTNPAQPIDPTTWLWTGEVPPHTVLEFKRVRRGDTGWEWESGENRYVLSPGPGQTLEVNLEPWNSGP